MVKVAITRAGLITAGAHTIGLCDPQWAWHDLAQLWQSRRRNEDFVANIAAGGPQAGRRDLRP